jgi:hypothetical protein
MQRFIMIAGYLPYLFESTLLNIIDPGGEVFDNVTRHLLQLFPRSIAQLYSINHIGFDNTPIR